MKRLAPVLAFALSGCLAAPPGPAADPWNPVGWPSAIVYGAGRITAESGAPFMREIGRLLLALSDLLQAPALAVEAVGHLSPERARDAGEKLVVGTGGTVTASLNAPFFFVTGRNVDIARDADLVNSALAWMETVPPDRWRTSPRDRREFLFPKGTRVRASGQGLVWTIPEVGELVQSCEASPVFDTVLELAGEDYSAQERTWGFIVPVADDWDALDPRSRAETIVHEFYHQFWHLRGWFAGWSVVYWPAYGWTYLRKGWMGHWAEASGPRGAFAVDQALVGWKGESD